LPKPDHNKLTSDAAFTAVEYVLPHPMAYSTYLMLGTSNGYVWLCDARTNYFLYSVKVLEHGGVRRILSTFKRTIIEGDSDTIMRSWPVKAESTPGDPNAIFMAREETLSLDGRITGSSYEDLGQECIVGSAAGTIWFSSWEEHATIKIKSCHPPSGSIKAIDYKYLPPSQF